MKKKKNCGKGLAGTRGEWLDTGKKKKTPFFQSKNVRVCTLYFELCTKKNGSTRLEFLFSLHRGLSEAVEKKEGVDHKKKKKVIFTLLVYFN